MRHIIRRQPKALPYLFLTEMWERYGFYVVQGLLILYMTRAFGFSDDKSYTILGAFTALAYIAPLLGGILADKVLGYKISIFWGGLLLSAGYALLALPLHHMFYLALATIIIGNGLFKPNISSLLGALYPPGDTQRDTGFTIFYIGINLGVLLAGFSSGYIKDHFGWHAGFALASFGLLLGVGIFICGAKRGVIQITQKKLIHTFSGKHHYLLWLIFAALAIIGINFLLQHDTLAQWLFISLGCALIVFLFILAYRYPAPERQRLITLNILIISSVIFWAIFWQMFFSVNLYIDRIIDKTFFGLHISTTVFYSLESIFIIILGPLFAWSWQTLDRNDRNPSNFIKFVLALVILGLAFLTLSISTHFHNAAGAVQPFWIVAAYLLITIGEMLLSPIGLAAVTVLSPPKIAGMMMGIWFVALGFGGQVAGLIAKLADIPEENQNSLSQLPIYHTAFLKYALLSFLVAIILFIVQRALLKSSSARV